MQIEYKCDNCGKIVKITNDSKPLCCGKPMTKLPLEPCIQPAHAEHARPMDSEDSCDDGRAG